MIDTIFSIAKMIVMILPFAFLCFRGEKVNLSKPYRSRQFPMPVAALVFDFAAMLIADSLCNWIIRLIESLPGIIARLGHFSWSPAALTTALDSVSGILAGIIDKLSLHFWAFFIANTVIILAYFAFKGAALSVIDSFAKKNNELHQKVASLFYDYYPDKDKWCLKDEYFQARSFLKALYYASIIISTVLMLISSKMYSEKLFRSLYYPAFGIILVGELYFYLDGLTRREYVQDILGEDDDAEKTVNYSLLRKFLRNLFGDKLLTENTGSNNALSYSVTNEEVIDDLQKNDDPKISTFGYFVEGLNATGFKLDHSYVASSVDLLNGKSILFNNPFYSDLIPYAFYPMNRALLSHGKVLVVLGRHAIEDDIVKWLEDGISSVTNLPYMWNIGVLGTKESNPDIGIITRSDVLNIELHHANAQFLEQVTFCVIIEPSKLISTAQIGLNLIIKKCRKDEDKNITFCLCDKNCDGLVDAMSHILLTNLTEVSATLKHTGTSSYMCWEADDEYLHHRMLPDISRYLGLGTELSIAALKNQVSVTKWYGGEAFPVSDISWIDKQYYYDLLKYASLPINQETLDRHFKTSPNFWSAEVCENNYITVEDEAFNMFEILRDFSTRAKEQGFINVISTDYLLKDYMADNASIFETDAKAIPCIVADYARTTRNTIFRLILNLSTFPLTEAAIVKELSLIGIKVFDLKKQLWFEIFKCFADIETLSAIPEDYKEAYEAVYDMPLVIPGGCEFTITSDVIKEQEKFNLSTGKMEDLFFIEDPEFRSVCVSDLKSAGYITEDEKGEKYYLGSELCSHIYQRLLPGQFFTFGGKYYEMQYLTANGEVLVRRAADHINSRPVYRQLRNYFVSNIKPSDKIGSVQDIDGFRIAREYADFSVKTPGYYRMERYNDFKDSSKVIFEGEVSGIPERFYNNKEWLRIQLPAVDEEVPANIRYTITVLMNEVFRTLFAENQPYIIAVTDDSHIEDENAVRPLTYTISGEGIDKNSIYIIEDSRLDLGLTVTVERNIRRIFRIIWDYLDWHRETLDLSLNPPPEPPQVIIVPVSPEEEKKEGEEDGKKKGFFRRIGDALLKPFRKLKEFFKNRKKKKKGEGEEAGENPDNPDGTDAPEEKKKGFFGRLKEKFSKKKKKGEEPEPDGMDIPVGEEPFVPDGEEVPSDEEEPFVPVDEEIPSDGEEPFVPDGEEVPSDGEEPFVPDGEEVPSDEEEPFVPDDEEVPSDGEESFVPVDEEIPSDGEEPFVPDGEEIPSDGEEPFVPDGEEVPSDEEEPFIPDGEEVPSDEEEPAVPEDIEVPAESEAAEESDDTSDEDDDDDDDDFEIDPDAKISFNIGYNFGKSLDSDGEEPFDPENAEAPVDEEEPFDPENAEVPVDDGEAYDPEGVEVPTDDGEPFDPEGVEVPTDDGEPFDPEGVEVPTDDGEPYDPEGGENPTDDGETYDPEGEEVPGEETPDGENPDGDGIDYVTEDDRAIKHGPSNVRKPYHERYYMKFGFESEPDTLAPDETYDYLTGAGFDRNPLKQARDAKKIAKYIEETYDPNKPNARYCDFCGCEITGVEFETLADGRDRCNNCSKTAIKSGEEFRRIFEDVKRNMETLFGIKINTGIKVEMVDSKKLHRRLGKAFIPTPAFDGRVLGVAIKDKNGYTLMVENGSPRMASTLTMVHELTHIWQYLNWDEKAIDKKYGKDLSLEIYEGMAKWAEVQYAYLINEPATAKRQEILTALRDDEYGRGFVRYRAAYPFSTGTVLTKPTPFSMAQEPLAEAYCGTIESAGTGTVQTGKKKGKGFSIPGEEKIGKVKKAVSIAALLIVLAAIIAAVILAQKAKASQPDDPAPVPPVSQTDVPPDSPNTTGFHYSRLSENHKKLYDQLLAGIKDYKESFEVSGNYTSNDVLDVFQYIPYDHPELFWFDINNSKCIYDEVTDIVMRVEIKYSMTKEEAQARQKEIDAAMAQVRSKLAGVKGEYETVLAVHDYLVSTIDYDSIGLEKQGDVPPSPDDLRSVYGALVNKKSVCAGYAITLEYILNSLGMECGYITGTGDTELHAWNIVKVDGKYYYMDVTWDDSSNTDKDKDNGDAIGHEYFCVTTQEIEKRHTADEMMKNIPECTSTDCDFYAKNGMLVSEDTDEAFNAALAAGLKDGDDSAEIKFSTYELYNKYLNKVQNDDDANAMTEYAESISGKNYSSYEYSYPDSEPKDAAYVITLSFRV